VKIAPHQQLQVSLTLHLIHIQLSEPVPKATRQLLLAHICGWVHAAEESEVTMACYRWTLPRRKRRGEWMEEQVKDGWSQNPKWLKSLMSEWQILLHYTEALDHVWLADLTALHFVRVEWHDNKTRFSSCCCQLAYGFSGITNESVGLSSRLDRHWRVSGVARLISSSRIQWPRLTDSTSAPYVKACYDN